MAFRSKSSTTHVTSRFFVTPNEAAPISYMTPITARCARSANRC